jgi:hypothetical protein
LFWVFIFVLSCHVILFASLGPVSLAHIMCPMKATLPYSSQPEDSPLVRKMQTQRSNSFTSPKWLGD